MTVADRIVKDLHEDDWKSSIVTSVNQLVELIQSGEKAVSVVTEVIGRDKQLTEKVLEAANSSHFKHRVREPIKTVAHAVLLLGLDTTRQLAMALSLLDKLFEPEQRVVLHEEMASAVLACSLASKLMDQVDEDNRDVPEVATLVKGLGRLVTAAYAYSEFQEINQKCKTDPGDTRPEVQILGASFDELARQAAKQLGIPEQYEFAVSQPFAKQVAALTTELAQGLVGHGLSLTDTRVSEVLEKMVDSFGLSRTTVVAMAESAVREFGAVKAALKACADTDMRTGRGKNRPRRRAATPVSLEATRNTLIASMDLVSLAASGAHPWEVAQKGAELLSQTGLFRNVLYCENVGFDMFQARAGVGPCVALCSRMWIVNIGEKEGLLRTALLKGASIHLGNAQETRVESNLPNWIKKTFGMPGSLLFIPLGAGLSASGFFYCDQSKAEYCVSDGVQEAIKSVKYSVLLAQRYARCVSL